MAFCPLTVTQLVIAQQLCKHRLCQSWCDSVNKSGRYYVQCKKNQLDAQFIFSVFRQTPLHV